MRQFIFGVVIILIIGLITAAFLPSYIDKTQSKNAAKGVLDNLIKQDYDKAFRSVYFYDRDSDLEPVIPYEEAKKKWIKRVTDLTEKGTYLVDYKQLRVNLEDTYPVGTVDLVMMEDGEKKVKENVKLWFGLSGDEWKLGNLDYRYNEIEEKWESALSGNFN